MLFNWLTNNPKHLPMHAPVNKDGTKSPQGTPVPKVTVICAKRSSAANNRALATPG